LGGLYPDPYWSKRTGIGAEPDSKLAIPSVTLPNASGRIPAAAGWSGEAYVGGDMISGLLLCILVSATSEPEIYVLSTGAPIWDVVAYDLNGDDQKDILALCSDSDAEPPQKEIAIFLANEDGGYPPQPSSVLALAETVGVSFLAEIDGESPKELVVVDHASATWYRFSNDEFTLGGEMALQSLLPGGPKEPVFLRNAAEDLDGDGIDEWIIPVPLGHEIYNAGGRISAVPSDVVSETRQAGTTYIIHRLPSVASFKFGDMQHKGIAFLSDEAADFSYGTGWTEHTRFRIPVDLADKWDSSTTIKDINGDSIPDLMVTQTEGTAKMKVLTHIYIATGPFTYSETPTATFEKHGALTTPSLIDTNGDTQLDLVLIEIPLSVKSLFNYFVRNKLSTRINVHLFTDGGYSKVPSFRTNISLEAPNGREQVAYTMGDFNGDGFVDIAFGSGKNNLAIHAGTGRGDLSSRAIFTLDLPAFGIARKIRLDSDQKDDLVMFHPSGSNQNRIDVVRF